MKVTKKTILFIFMILFTFKVIPFNQRELGGWGGRNLDVESVNLLELTPKDACTFLAPWLLNNLQISYAAYIHYHAFAQWYFHPSKIEVICLARVSG